MKPKVQVTKLKRESMCSQCETHLALGRVVSTYNNKIFCGAKHKFPKGCLPNLLKEQDPNEDGLAVLRFFIKVEGRR